MRANFLDLTVSCHVIARRKYGKNKLLCVDFILTVGLFVPYASDKAAAAQARNDPAPSFTLKLLSGKDFDFSELKGKPAVLKFVSSY